MFRIRRIYDDVLPVNKLAIREVQKIYFDWFPGAPPEDIEQLPDRLRNPFRKNFRTILYVAEKSRHHVAGFAIVLFDPVIDFCYLDYLAAEKLLPGRGIGSAIYEHVRDEAADLDVRGIFFECLPDGEASCPDPKVCRQNAARLRFYERYGARPIVGTAYESPVPGGSPHNLPHLMFDGLNRQQSLRASYVRSVVRAVLERKYSDLCPPEYVQMVVDSIRDPVKLRNPKTIEAIPVAMPTKGGAYEKIAVAVNEKHQIHHIRERGYVESPVRIKAIQSELESDGLIETIAVKEYPLKHILAVHDSELVEYLRRACESAPEGRSIYPYVFPIRNAARPPKDLARRAGYYCIDTFTPIHRNAYPAAKRAVDCVLTAADEILHGRRIAYALIRPPGHHAERRSFGGFCYFSNAAIGANLLSQLGKVAIVDIDFHHGNGQQDIFYQRADVYTISLHGDPSFAYPFFTGFADERGAGPGEGFNLNLPLPETLDGPGYRQALRLAVQKVREFDPAFLVIALGLDTAKGDPTGTWSLVAKDFETNGRMLGALQLPTLVVQEGGYRTRTLGKNAKAFLHGLVEGAHEVH